MIISNVHFRTQNKCPTFSRRGDTKTIAQKSVALYTYSCIIEAGEIILISKYNFIQLKTTLLFYCI